MRALLTHLFSSSGPARTRGHALGAPHLYDISAGVFFFGRRRATFQRLIAAAEIHGGQHVLDVGCGTGYFVRLLAGVVGPEGLVVGVDPSPEMIAYANKKTAAENCRFQVGVAESLEFPDAHFDVVVSSLMIHHLPEDLRVPALREMRRVLQPDGKLLVADAQGPSRGVGLRLLFALAGHGHMTHMVAGLESMAAQAEFAEIRSGEALPWLRYVVAVKPAASVIVSG